MKNFQQTPKQRRLVMAGNKALFSQSRSGPFQPREAWSTKRKLGGVPCSVLESKQLYVSEHDYYSAPFTPRPRQEQRLHERVHKDHRNDDHIYPQLY